ncbi:hypothetical protein [Tritonibacter mobilis]|uniref:Uncharacterized protein n=1 Tax=Tritonibacter mobilis F1926 TaxID=1265309 RepID=A0A1B1A9R2_9RHOB|nr:hypothetical protein [Tritonibacter mobilis]ANP43325.1 hypothetical protein K529_021455 [Tritonibacter mobilis F1926]KJZ22269.1 hypothetical protein TW79_18750 [Tritonibacter mobilis]
MKKLLVSTALVLAAPASAEQKPVYTQEMIDRCSSSTYQSTCLKIEFLSNLYLQEAGSAYGTAASALIDGCREVNERTDAAAYCVRSSIEDAHTLNDMIGANAVKDVCKRGIAEQPNKLELIRESFRRKRIAYGIEYNLRENNGFYNYPSEHCTPKPQEEAVTPAPKKVLDCEEGRAVQAHFKTASDVVMHEEVGALVKQINADVTSEVTLWSENERANGLGLYFLKEKHPEQYQRVVSAFVASLATDPEMKDNPFAAMGPLFVAGMFEKQANEVYSEFQSNCQTGDDDVEGALSEALKN